ncbi:MAG TPA: hypothetical protein VE733_08900 [Streptosporangiaceae bacterium]|nr:hypothetical protein [Streptosporangiaceae bacterium]
MSGEDIRPDRHVLLELDALLAQIEALLAEGGRERFDADDRYRWVLHRLWIAVGNEALAYARLTGRTLQAEQPWGRLYRLRNMLAHDRLPDIDEDEVWRMTVMRTASLRKQIRDLLT